MIRGQLEEEEGQGLQDRAGHGHWGSQLAQLPLVEEEGSLCLPQVTLGDGDAGTDLWKVTGRLSIGQPGLRCSRPGCSPPVGTVPTHSSS